VQIDGPSVLLEPNAAQAIAVILPELATNAAKYGALSVPNGHVRIDWSHEQNGQLVFRWTEKGDAPTRGQHSGRAAFRLWRCDDVHGGDIADRLAKSDPGDDDAQGNLTVLDNKLFLLGSGFRQTDLLSQCVIFRLPIFSDCEFRAVRQVRFEVLNIATEADIPAFLARSYFFSRNKLYCIIQLGVFSARRLSCPYALCERIRSRLVPDAES
jgi:hypothetical protein